MADVGGPLSERRTIPFQESHITYLTVALNLLNHSSMRNKSSNNEMVRITQIDKLSYSVFGHLAPDELDSLEREFEFATTRMLQVVEIKSKHILVMDLHEDLTFKPVFLPDNIMHLLRRGDTLLGSIGLKASSWHLFYMSPLYY